MAKNTNNSNHVIMLSALYYISCHGGVTTAELSDELNVSKATIARILANLRNNYDVELVFTRFSSGGGEYVLESWGIFNEPRLKNFLGK